MKNADLALHFRQSHPQPASFANTTLEESFDTLGESFDFLPPGEDSVRINAERRQRSGGKSASSVVNYANGKFIDSFSPSSRKIGSKGWLGYAAYIFDPKGFVILESPLSNHATYVLRGDWKRQARLTKAEVLRENLGERTRFFHTPTWETRIAAFLR